MNSGVDSNTGAHPGCRRRLPAAPCTVLSVTWRLQCGCSSQYSGRMIVPASISIAKGPFFSTQVCANRPFTFRRDRQRCDRKDAD
ncbi:unnamed protein product, partial [Prorocentrum cordatum]